jgi:hypothetical protein
MLIKKFPKAASDFILQNVKIRKDLHHQVSDYIQYLVWYAMLHDFVHTAKRESNGFIEGSFRKR